MDYKKLLEKARKELPKQKETGERFEIPRVKGHIQGNKTIINNFSQIANTLRRDQAHLLKYILKELATPGDIIKGSAIIGSKISSSRVNEKIEKYAQTFVICKECGKPDTKLLKKDSITKLKCTACGATYMINSKI